MVFRPLWGLTIWTVLGLAMLIGLGVWQVERLYWKEDLIARVNTQIHAQPEPLQEAIDGGFENSEWRHVTVTGRFENDKELYLFAPGPHGEPGVQVITPLQADNGAEVLINRGWVPDARADPATRVQGQIAGETTVTGIVRRSVQPGWFTPDPDYARRRWFSKTAESMAAVLHTEVLPLFVEADATPNPGGYPIGGQTVVEFPNNHLQYAITWFGLALALMGVYLAYHVRQGRLRFGK